MLGRSVSLATVLLALSGSFANAHGSHSSDQNPSSDWATRHMQGALLSSIAPVESRVTLLISVNGRGAPH